MILWLIGSMILCHYDPMSKEFIEENRTFKLKDIGNKNININAMSSV